MVTVSFFMGALLLGMGADRARIYSHTTQAKRREVATIRGDTSQALKWIDTKGQLADQVRFKICLYPTVPVHPCHRKHLKFCWQDQLWQFAVFPYSAPIIFTKLMKPVVTTLRKSGCLDNMLIMTNSQDKARDHCQCAIYLLSSLGFVLNVEKSM